MPQNGFQYQLAHLLRFAAFLLKLSATGSRVAASCTLRRMMSRQLAAHGSEALSEQSPSRPQQRTVVAASAASAAAAAAAAEVPIHTQTKAALTKQALYRSDASIRDLFGDLDGAMLWDAIKDAFQVCFGRLCVWTV